MFTSNHYLSGLSVSELHQFNACRFFYRSLSDIQSHSLSTLHGNWKRPINATYQYHLVGDERIEKVLVQTTDEPLVDGKDTYYNILRVEKFQFITTIGRLIPPDVVFNGDTVKLEHFEGYTLGYATGGAYLIIDQLQFIWYRTE